MYTVGMFGGKFLPLTMGHVRCIAQAATIVDKLYVILSYDEQNEKRICAGSEIESISVKERYKWLYQVTRDMPNVKVIAVQEAWEVYNKYGSRRYNWEKHTEAIKIAINERIDTVFFGGDYEMDHWRRLYPEASCYYQFARTDEDISATKIRLDGPFAHWDEIPNVCKPYYTKKICIVGTESCGKSTLVNNLATYYNTNQVKEYGRDVCEEVGGAENMQPKDFKKILCGQIMLEEEAIKHSNKFLFVDSEQIVTDYYLDLYNEDTSDNYIQASRLAKVLSRQQQYDLVILMAPTVPWVNDGTRLHGEDEVRKANHEKLKEMYDDLEIAYVEITSSSYNNRFLDALRYMRGIE